MKSLRRVIRKLILESEGIEQWDVFTAAAEEGNRRYMGHYAKKIFAQQADIDYLKSLTYIHTKSFDRVDSFLQANKRDELSCIVMEPLDQGHEIPYAFGDFVGTSRVGFVIKGWPTWVQNKNASTGHTGRLMDKYHGGERPPSGVNKAPSKMFGMGLPPHQLQGVIMDEEDAEAYGLYDFDDRPNKNNEATLDNWECVGVIRIVKHVDHEDTITDEYNQKIDEVIAKVQTRWPKAKVIEAVID